jgi:hypothetical protein
MRATVSTSIPISATSGELAAFASLLGALEKGRWDALSAMFDKMSRQRAELSPALERMVGALASQYRSAARERELVVEDGHDQAVVNVATKGRL